MYKKDKKVFLMTLYASVGNARLQLMKNAKARQDYHEKIKCSTVVGFKDCLHA